jgi:hypothetical protein
MKYFLIEFDRKHEKLLHLTEFPISRVAMDERFRRELEIHDENAEIVVLGAMSKEALVRTHSRYFNKNLALNVE